MEGCLSVIISQYHCLLWLTTTALGDQNFMPENLFKSYSDPIHQQEVISDCDNNNNQRKEFVVFFLIFQVLIAY